MGCFRKKAVQPLLQLDKLWSLLSTSVGGLSIDIALPVLEAISLVFTTQITQSVKLACFNFCSSLSNCSPYDNSDSLLESRNFKVQSFYQTAATCFCVKLRCQMPKIECYVYVWEVCVCVCVCVCMHPCVCECGRRVSIYVYLILFLICRCRHLSPLQVSTGRTPKHLEACIGYVHSKAKGKCLQSE